MKPNTQKPFYKWEVVLLLWFAYFLNQGDRQVFNTVLPHIQAFLGASDATMGLISTCFNIFFACTVPFAGYFADRISRKKIIVFSVALFSVATVFTGFANSVILMILMRSVSTGMGEAMFGPTYPAIIASWHGPQTRARAMSLHQTAYYVGVITSGFLAGLIADKLGWQYSFVIFGSLGVVFAVVLGLRLVEKPDTAPSSSIVVEDKPSFFEAMGAIFRVPTAVCLIVGFTSLIFVLTGYLTWMPKYLMTQFNLTGASAGLHSMLWTHAAAFVGVLWAGNLSDKVAAGKGGAKNRILLQALGLLLAAPCIVLMGLGSKFAVVCAALAGFGFFRAFFDANTYSILYDVIPRRYHSSSSAVLQMFGFGMGSLAPLILGILSPKLGLSKGIALLGIIWVLAAIVLLVARRFFFDKDAARLADMSGKQAPKAATEQDSHFSSLEKMSTAEILEGINSEDRTVALAVAKTIPTIEKLVNGIVERGGRIFYMGAGTSGRLGVVDASEIPPTYGVSGKFIGIIAGGDGAFRNAIEGAEDNGTMGVGDLMAFNPTSADTLVGISASGGAPYVVEAVKKARETGMLTGCICCNAGGELARVCEYPMVAEVGPEFVTGSTRMKSGTAAKLILNMISTAVMIRTGHVQGNKMVDMQLTNKKLVDRGARMIMEKTGITDYSQAKALLLEHGSVRAAVNAYLEQ